MNFSRDPGRARTVVSGGTMINVTWWLSVSRGGQGSREYGWFYGEFNNYWLSRLINKTEILNAG